MPRRFLLLGGAILLGVVALAAGLTARPASAPTAAPVVGRQAPDFSLPDANSSRSVSLSSFRGHTVLVNFFATWCVPCIREMPEIEHAFRADSSRLVVLGVDKQEPVGDVRALQRHLRITYPLLLDSSLTVWQRYRVALQPVSFWIDAEGTVRAIHFGPMSSAYIEREAARLQA